MSGCPTPTRSGWCPAITVRPIWAWATTRSRPTAIPNSDSYQVPNLALPAGVDGSRAQGRRGLLGAFDRARRDVDASGLMDGPRPVRPPGVLDGPGPGGPPGVRPQQGRSAAARPLWPPPVGPERTAGATARRGGRPVRHADVQRLGFSFEPRERNEARASAHRLGGRHA